MSLKVGTPGGAGYRFSDKDQKLGLFRLRQVNRSPGADRRAVLASLHTFAAGGDLIVRVRDDDVAPWCKNVLSSIHAMYRYLVSVELLVVDPSATVKPPRVVLKPGMHLTAKELRALLDAPGGDARERFVTFLLVYTGARTNEVRTLRWMDVRSVGRMPSRLLGDGDSQDFSEAHGTSVVSGAM